MSYPNVPITQTPDWVRRVGQAVNYLLNNPGSGGTTTNAATFNNSGAGAASSATFNGSAAVTVSYNTVGAQPLDGTLTALAAVNWSAGTQVLTLTAADTFTLKTVGTAAGNILDKAAGDSLYQPLNSNLTGLAALTFSQGDIIYRDGSGVQRLAAGTSGQFLKTQGSGANPVWASAAVTAVDGASVATAESTTSTSYTDLTTTGPSVTLTTGTRVKVTLCAASQKTSVGAGNSGFISVAVSGATTTAAADGNAALAAAPAQNFGVCLSRTIILTVTAGSNTFKMQYRCDGGTWQFQNRSIIVEAI